MKENKTGRHLFGVQETPIRGVKREPVRHEEYWLQLFKNQGKIWHQKGGKGRSTVYSFQGKREYYQRMGGGGDLQADNGEVFPTGHGKEKLSIVQKVCRDVR